MMRWRSDQTNAESSEVLQSASSKSSARSDYEPDTTTSCAAHDATPEGSQVLHSRLEDDEDYGEAVDIMTSSAADSLVPKELNQSQQQSESLENTKQENMNINNKHSLPSQQRGLTEAEPPDTDTETTATSAAVTTAQVDEDDGGDHATEEDDSRTPANIPWKPQNIQSTCEFTHKILDYAQKRESGCKKAEYSAVTTDELGNRWRLIVYVNGNGRASNHHLSLFLQVADADDLPFGWKKSVSYVLTLEHPTGGNLSYAKRNPDKTFKLCPKAIDWGWSQFITSDRIQQEGFVKADTLTVRAQVTVKSSSVEIDEEDAELYLKCAVEEGDANAVKLCLEQGASVNCQFKDDLYTPLHTACSSGTAAGSMEVLQLLLERGADGNACNKWRETPLLIAANNGHRMAVEALLQHEANPSLCSEAGWSALTFAAHKGYDDIVALLLKAGAPVNCPVTEDLSTPLHKACAGSKPGHLAAVKLLLNGGANVHALNKWRETPLLTAANHGQAGAVEALLDAGADPCKCTDTGWSPLSIAAYKGHDDVVRLLLEEGAPTEEDDPTLSALLQAATKGLPDTVELLLQHEADHTVTTKKGDTALSILVEQNLIDAAVDMVTKYSASIPRCSRDRKKVQRARLLINLRMKQLEKEGKGQPCSTGGDESDDEEARSNAAQHIAENGTPTTTSTKNDKGKKKSKMSAEEKAKAAEEALLLELAKEEDQAKKIEAEANTKRAKKKKKKEKEKQQKLKEEIERQEKEKQEARKREEQQRIQREKEEKERRDRELKQQQEKEREMKEILAKEKLLAAKRKDREERDRREKEQKQSVRNRKPISRELNDSTSPSGSRSNSNEKRGQKIPRGRKVATDPTPSRKIVSPKSKGNKVIAPLTGNRRWETATQKTNKASPKAVPSSDASQSSTQEQIPYIPQTATTQQQSVLPHPPVVNSSTSALISPRPSPQMTAADPIEKPLQSPVSHSPKIKRSSDPRPVAASDQSLDSQSTFVSRSSAVEHPAISLFRRDKVAELLHCCTSALNNLIDDATLKRVIYRWIVRATHGTEPYTDSLIPSWTNTEELVAFFQRQFIAENRRHFGPGGLALGAAPSMESLKDAGSSVAFFCQNLAKQVQEYRERIEGQLPQDWTDAALGMTASDGTLNGSGATVTISWANRAQVFMPYLIFATLRDRHIGGPGSTRFLASVFAAKVWYDTTRMISQETSMDYRLPPSTQACLSVDQKVSAELFSDPFTALSSNVFWGRFEEVDSLFGGQKPFGKDENGSEGVLARHGGSISVLLPLDNVVASQYIQRMIAIMDAADSSNTPVSFWVFVHADSFHDLIRNGPSANDLHLLDPRLGEDQSRRHYVQRVEVLPAGQHAYHAGDGTGSPVVCTTTSLLVVLQNTFGKSHFGFNNASIGGIFSSMSVMLPENSMATHTLGLAHGFPQSMEPQFTPNPGFFSDSLAPISPEPQRGIRSEFGTIGGNGNPMTASSPMNKNQDSHRTRRGRLFALEDNGGEEDQLGDMDMMVSGMLNLDVAGLFQNTNVGSDNIDIEAISLMGIGPPAHSLNSGNPRTGRLG